MIDLHSHILPALDDGPESMEESIAMARAAVSAGTRTLLATPHVDYLHGVDPAAIPPAVAAVNSALEREDVELRVLQGAEIAPARLPEFDDATLRGLALGGGQYLLVECPFTGVIDLEPMVAELHERGHRVVLAHPERCPGLRLDPGQLQRLVQAGALASLTDGSLDGRFGKSIRHFAETLLCEGLVHNVASDAHDAVRRPPDLGHGLRRAERALRGLAQHRAYLTEATPTTIIGGGELPGRPARPYRRRRLWR